MSILIGLIVPIPFWLLHKKFPKWGLDQVITPMIAVQIGGLSSGINSSIFMTFLLCCAYWILYCFCEGALIGGVILCSG